jgi:O-antigen/teichoic acid export membrane protein
MRAPRSFAGESTLTFAANALALVANLLTGVIVARALGPHGRGEFTAIMILPQMLGWVFAMGCAQAVSYRLARVPKDGPRLFVTWVLMLGLLGVLAIVIGEALLPLLFDAQTSAARSAARVYLLVVLLVLLAELLNGMLLGRGDVLFFNLMRIGWAGGLAVVYLVLVVAGSFTVVMALIASALVAAALSAITLVRVIRQVGLGRPSAALGRSTLSYGVRAHGANVTGLVTQRLDLFIIPAFLSASTIGLYSVATNVSWIVVTIAGALSVILLPAAARRNPEAGNRLVIASLHVTLLLGGVMAGAIAVTADLLLPLIYGSGFEGSALPLRLLLPGAVLYAGAAILWTGLYAVNRPFTATVTQLPGLVVTIAGLVIFLPSYGIEAAAIISTVAYSIVFITALVLYRRAAGVSWRAFRLDPSELIAVASRLWPARLRPKAKEVAGRV